MILTNILLLIFLAIPLLISIQPVKRIVSVSLIINNNKMIMLIIVKTDNNTDKMKFDPIALGFCLTLISMAVFETDF